VFCLENKYGGDGVYAIPVSVYILVLYDLLWSVFDFFMFFAVSPYDTVTEQFSNTATARTTDCPSNNGNG